jgi:GT2 family glycosyltransferase
MAGMIHKNASMPPPKVSVVLVHLNQEAHTRECIESLQRLSYENVEIIVVDNGSTDGSGARLSAQFPSVVFTRTDKNSGFAEGNNVGIRLALQRNAEYIALLNNDTVVDRDFIQPLVELSASDLSLAVQSCKIYYHSEPQVLWYAGGFLDQHKALGTHVGILKPDEGQYDEIKDTGFATGCMMFISQDALRSVGLLDNKFFIYLEDVDWCVRARNLGYRVVYNPRAKLWHKVSTTHRIDSPFYLYFTLRNKILFLRKHSSPFQLFLHLPYFLYFYSRHLVRMSLKWHSLAGTNAVIRGIIDGLRNYTGECGEGHLSSLGQSQ